MRNKQQYRLTVYVALLGFFFLLTQAYSQNYADKNYYLVDSLKLDELSIKEKQIIDSALIIYHKAKLDTVKLNAIKIIVDESWNYSVWPKYNRWNYEFVKNKLGDHSNLTDKEKEDPVKNRLLRALALSLDYMGHEYRILHGNSSLALDYHIQGLEIRESIGDNQGIAISLYSLGVVYEFKGNIPKAMEYHKKSLKVNEKIGNKTKIANSLNNIGLIYKNQGNTSEALKYYHKSLTIREEIGEKEGLANSFNNLGVLYKSQGSYDLALEYYFKSLKIAEEFGHEIPIALALSNIGTIYSNQLNFSEALNYLRKSLAIRENVGYKKSIGTILIKIGFVYENQGKTVLAIEYYKKSLKINEEIGYKSGIAMSLKNIGSIYLKAGDAKRAKKNAYEGMEMAKGIGYPAMIKDMASLLNRIYLEEDNWEKAYQFQELYTTMRDSIRNEKTEKDAIRQQSNYEIEKKKQEIIILTAQNELLIKDKELQSLRLNKNRILAISFSLGFGLVLILAIVIYKGYQRKQKINNLLKKQNEEKTAMLKEIHHRVKNNLQVVNSLLRLQSREFEDEYAISMFKEAQDRVLSMALLHEKMYRSDNLKHIDVQEHITLLIEDLVKSYAVGKKIKLNVVIEDVDISIQTLVPLGLIINEIITNALKYAFIDKKEGEITVHIKSLDNIKYEMIIGDNGIGLKEEKESKGIGTKLIQIFTKQLNGTLEKIEQPGTVYKLIFEKID